MPTPDDTQPPNAVTIEALQQARDQERLSEYGSLDELKAALD